MFLFTFIFQNNSHFPEETGVDQTRRHCSVEMIRGTGPSELGWSRPMSKNPLERAWPQWDQRRLSNRREQILHFDLSRKGREAITFAIKVKSMACIMSWHIPSDTVVCKASNMKCVKTEKISCATDYCRKLLITTYQEVNDQHWSNTCCDDENVRTSGNTCLPEQQSF